MSTFRHSRNIIFDLVNWQKHWAGSTFSISGRKFRLWLDACFCGSFGREARFRLFGPLGIYNIKREDPKSRNPDSRGGPGGLLAHRMPIVDNIVPGPRGLTAWSYKSSRRQILEDLGKLL